VRAPIAGITSTVAIMPAQVCPPKAYFAIDGQCFAFLPITEPQAETIQIFRTRRKG
jgi:hypothetical protein